MARLRSLAILFGPLALLVGCGKDNGEDTTNEAIVPEYQRKADAAKWRWSKEHASLHYSISKYLTDFEVKIAHNKPKEDELWIVEPLTITILDKETPIYSFRGWDSNVFTRLGNVIYIAEFCPIRTGCSLVAFDLKNRVQLWKSWRKGIGPVMHSKYLNLVNIEVDEGAILVFGNEAQGRYIEYVDLETGKTVGHKKLPPDLKSLL
jgi:hypothetical protein